MERNDLVDRLRGGGRQSTGQRTSQGFGYDDDNQGFGFEDLFAKMDLNGSVVSNMGSSGLLRSRVDGFVAPGDNLVPPGVNGLGFGGYNVFNNNVATGTNDMNMMMYRNNGYLNYQHPVAVGSQPFVPVHGDLENYYLTNAYLADIRRAQMMESWSRTSVLRNVGHNMVAAVEERGGGRVLDGVNLMDFKGHILGLAMSQNGCKMLQMQIGEITEEEIEMILEEVGDNVSSLMMDQFGNYFVQKLIEVCSEEQRTRIIHSVTKYPYQLINLCLNLHGTRAVQKLVEFLTTEQQISMVISAISPGVVSLIKDCNAYHVIQHCLKFFPDEHNMFLINEIARNCYAIATDKSGCCVLQLCVDITKGEIKQYLISEITANALQLSHDRYGNYVVQHLILMKVYNVTAKLMDQLQGHFLQLACNKYGSNVVEKCLTETSNEHSDLIILELLKTPGVSKLLQDPFGNYVFQSALSVSQGLIHNRLVLLVEKNAIYMSSNLYGKKVLAWFDDRRRLSLAQRNIRA